MMENKMFWYANMAGAVLGWCFVFYGLFASFESGMVNTLWWIVFFAWCFGHPLELTQSLPIGKKAGLTPETIFIKTMIFGLTWWVPLKNGVFEE